MASVDVEKGYHQGGPTLCLDVTSINELSPRSPTIIDIKEPPPTNEILNGRQKVTLSWSLMKSRGVDFLKGFLIILAGSLVFLGLLMAVPVAMIVMGSIHLYDCHAEVHIPIFLIGGGSVWIILWIVILTRAYCCKKSEETKGQEEGKKLKPLESFVCTVMGSWFLAGSVWVYGTYNHFDSDPASGNYCDHTLYWFAFWLITATYIMLGSLTFIWCIYLFVGSMKTRK
ncbi:transmembrane protein 272-like [Haliotis asinina]|uniref:transmembrane protein 272-like n=1 Tax=Haliotis asinina TaxID=109174 RepID=UPI0035323353